MSEPIPYATPVPRRSSHDNIYTVLLGAVAFFVLIVLIDFLFIIRGRANGPDPIWPLQMVFFTYLAFFLFAAVVLLIRIVWPMHRKWVTLALNIVFLLLFPFGTALAVYGFWKVDKTLPP